MIDPVLIGDATLYQGDCLDILPTLGKVDVIVADPPYGIINKFGTQKKLDGTRILEFGWDDEGITATVIDAIKICASIAQSAFVFCGLDQATHISDVVRQSGMIPKPAAWVKKCPPPALPGNWWPSGYELAVFGYRAGSYFNDTNPSRSNVFVADSYRHGQPGKVDHPTQKPLTLISKIVRAMVPPDGGCLDPFMGSGTTGVACAKLGRKFIGIELEPKYFDIACKRIEDAYNQPDLFIDPPKKAEQEILL